MPPLRIDVYCPRGFSYVRPNRVKVFMGGLEVTRAVGNLLAITHPPTAASLVDGDPPFARLVRWKKRKRLPFVNAREIETTHGESFGFEDWVLCLDELFNLPVVAHDETPYPNEELADGSK